MRFTFLREHYWFPSVLLSLIIFGLSSITIPIKPPVDVPFYDKWVHMVVYACLGWCYLNTSTQGFTKVNQRRLLLGFGMAVLYGVSDEFHQSFVPGRFSEVHDVLADAIGAAIPFTWFMLRLNRFK